ncbi:uncharacterized protein BDZ99DRAFT_395369 [Mytilinidion resinicola]|uniref:Large ribosomal subunit protein mL53 n=1 Tax=Mytilinidion resinicola TaxID=574789 RepID=A0A6A6YDA3_9PEZI|nr:uncharacterized protein BDZ99DRAFT_395369 [Mytilinidion resinicola]KAF2806075.1 hypothetical protein BDZ99DRAFT_395369 [Mytilinidion resinicola]
MITRFLSEVRTSFNPFSPLSKTARTFLAQLPPDARSQGMVIKSTILPRTSTQKPELAVKFKDGKKLKLDLATMRSTEVMAEVDRHSRILARKEELSG